MNTHSKLNYPLTKSQHLIWTGQVLFPNSPLYHVPYLFYFKGTLDPTLFRRAFQELVNSTDVLRTIIIEKEADFQQQILATYPYTVPEIVLSGSLTEDPAEAWARERSLKPLDQHKPLFDAALLKHDEKRYTWYFNMHHVFTDALSAALIFERLGAIYTNLKEGNEPLANLEIQGYRHYIPILASQNEQQVSPAITQFWQDKLNRLPNFPRLYGNENLPLDTRTRRVSIPLGKVRYKKIQETLAQRGFSGLTRQMSLTNFFTSVLAVYLRKISGQREFTIGIPVHNRSTFKEKNTPGLFMGVYPVIAKVQPSESIRAVAANNYKELTRTLGHCDPAYTPAEISRKINIIVNYLPARFGNFADMATEAKWIHPGHSDPMHYIRLHIAEFNKDSIPDISADLSVALFPEDIMSNFRDEFLINLDALLENPDKPLGEFPLVDKTTEQTYRKQFDLRTKAPKAVTFLELFRKQVQQHPDRIAFTFHDSAYTYKQFHEKSSQWAAVLMSEGCESGDPVGVQLRRSEDYMFAVLAIMQAGGVFIPIPNDLPAKRRDYIIEDSNCTKIITKQSFNPPGNVRLLTPEELSRGAVQKVGEAAPPGLEDRAYIIYTSGSTGNPKGVAIKHSSLGNYLDWARDFYSIDKETTMPLFTSLGFDLTLTSTLLPLVAGGRVLVIDEPAMGPDLSALRIWSMKDITAIKLTPSHLSLIVDRNPELPDLKTLIVGGENFQTALAEQTTSIFGDQVAVFNEYGPTEATIGCLVHRYEPTQAHSIPIGQPIPGMGAYILNENLNLTPPGVPGEIYLTGVGLSSGYMNRPELNKERFLIHPESGDRFYRTGDLGRWRPDGLIVYLGRNDEQVKVHGHRVELQEIEAVLAKHPAVDAAAVTLDAPREEVEESGQFCVRCGLPSEYPTADFDENNVCHLCRSFSDYQSEVAGYFKTETDLYKRILGGKKTEADYDCLSLLSGGKDSTYVLAKLVDMGFKVLAFTLDNGYISEQAKANIEKIVTALGVDHVYGSTAHMNDIFVDSLQRHANVCNGCFKTIYTLSTQIALKHSIPFIITGLSRGQFFETRLSEETFMDFRDSDRSIDDLILEARKLYHQEEDAIKQLLDTRIFKNEETFEKVQFIDFYRYTDVQLSELLKFLKEKIGWERPTDTGRSTNCLINQLGIYVHKKKKGYSNYAFPYSWDVRLGHKTREESIEEINEYLDEKEIRRMMREIGYFEDLAPTEQLVAYVTGDSVPDSGALRAFLAEKLPGYMIPTVFKKVQSFPITTNGKVDKEALQKLSQVQIGLKTTFVAPRNDFEELLAEIWSEVLQLEQLGVYDNFIDLGGHSLAAIRITGRINRELTLELPLSKIFQYPTIADYGKYLETTLEELMALDDEKE